MSGEPPPAWFNKFLTQLTAQTTEFQRRQEAVNAKFIHVQPKSTQLTELRGVDRSEYHQRHKPQEFTKNEECVLKHVSGVPRNFDGRLDPKVFLDWLSDMEHYFEWHDMSESRRVHYAKLKLVEQARTFWMKVEQKIRRLRKDPLDLTWDEMKKQLIEKCVPSFYRRRLINHPILQELDTYGENNDKSEVIQSHRLPKTITSNRKPLDPIPVLVSPSLSESVHASAQHIHDSHAEIKSQINISDEKYEFAADNHSGSKESDVDDHVEDLTPCPGLTPSFQDPTPHQHDPCHLPVQSPQPLPVQSLQLLPVSPSQPLLFVPLGLPDPFHEPCDVHVQLIQPVPPSPFQSPTAEPSSPPSQFRAAFNPDHHFVHPIGFPEPIHNTLPAPLQPLPILPPLPSLPLEREKMEFILVEEVVSTVKGEHQLYQMTWKPRSMTVATCVTTRELQCLAPDLWARLWSLVSAEERCTHILHLPPTRVDREHSTHILMLPPARVDRDILLVSSEVHSGHILLLTPPKVARDLSTGFRVYHRWRMRADPAFLLWPDADPLD